jgi:hypothetical protein
LCHADQLDWNTCNTQMADRPPNPIGTDAIALFATDFREFVFLTPILAEGKDMWSLCPVNCATIVRWNTKAVPAAEAGERRGTYSIMRRPMDLVWHVAPHVLRVQFSDFGKAWLSGSDDDRSENERVCRSFYKVRLLMMPANLVTEIAKLTGQAGPLESLHPWLAKSEFVWRYNCMYRDCFEPFPRHVTRLILEDALRSKSSCPVTMESITPANIAATSCGHVFSQLGIRKALDSKPECPVCRVKCAVILTDGLVDSSNQGGDQGQDNAAPDASKEAEAGPEAAEAEAGAEAEATVIQT